MAKIGDFGLDEEIRDNTELARQYGPFSKLRKAEKI